jgi:hypothetical protein
MNKVFCWAMGAVAANAHSPAESKIFAPLFSKSGCFLS